MPKALGAALVGHDLGWDYWNVFFVDERCVPLSDADSNFKAADEHFFSKVRIPKDQIFALEHGAGDECNPREAAADYTAKLEKVFFEEPESHQPGDLPRFDLVLLGLGGDGHTASLFPGHALLEEKEAWVAAISDSPKPPPKRITMTLPVLQNAASVAFIASGAGKSDMVLTAVHPQAEPHVPAARVVPFEMHDNLHWIVDDGAGAG